MKEEKQIYIVIVAGGQGTRMGTAVPKQFLELDGKPVLFHTIKAFADALPGSHLALVLPSQQLSYAQMVLKGFEDRIDITIVAGGETRFHSVKNGLKGFDKLSLTSDAIIMVHDGVRPLVSSALIQKCYEQAIEKGSAIPVVPVADSIRKMEGENSIPVDRSLLRSIQTPQAFKASILIPAFQQDYKETFTDEATVVEAMGTKVFLVEGEATNIKITNPHDLVVAEAWIRLNKEG